MKQSRGTLHRKTRRLTKKKRFTVAEMVKTFKIGDKVTIATKPFYKGLPNPRYNNKTGIIVEERGSSYVVKIRDGNAYKNLISRPIHLMAYQGKTK